VNITLQYVNAMYLPVSDNVHSYVTEGLIPSKFHDVLATENGDTQIGQKRV
jgi:hypothetical protein